MKNGAILHAFEARDEKMNINVDCGAVWNEKEVTTHLAEHKNIKSFHKEYGKLFALKFGMCNAECSGFWQMTFEYVWKWTCKFSTKWSIKFKTVHESMLSRNEFHINFNVIIISEVALADTHPIQSAFNGHNIEWIWMQNRIFRTNENGWTVSANIANTIRWYYFLQHENLSN